MQKLSDESITEIQAIEKSFGIIFSILEKNRYFISMVGIKNYYLYFNVIPGISKEYQFGTPISEKELVSCITIKANMKSSMY